MKSTFITLYTFCISVFLCLMPVVSLCAAEAPLTAEQIASYNQLILQEVQKADAAAVSALEKIGTSPNMSIGETTRLQLIVSMAQVKHSLVNSLLNTPSVLNSQAVRDRLLSIMKQDVIEEQDLLSLQALIDSVKAQQITPSEPAPTAPSPMA